MAYEPKEWQCGEYINNRDLNRIEEGIQEALAKECDCGYSCGSTYLEVFAETIEAVQEGSVNIAYGTADSELTDESIRVTIDGDSYILPRVNRENRNTRAPQLSYYYGEWDFSQFLPVFTTYPITIEGTEGSDNIIIYTQTEGEHQVEIAVLRNTVTTTDCFKIAVQSLTKPLIFSVLDATEVTEPCEGLRYTYSHSWQEVHDAFVAGRPCIVHSARNGVVMDDLVLQVFDAGQELSIASRYDNFDFTDKNSKTHIECSAE